MSTERSIVLVGPGTTRGPHDIPAELDAESLACIDDKVALVEERVISVDALWAEVLRHAVGDDADTVLLVVPSWWSARRIRRVTVAAERTCADVAVLLRRNLVHTNRSHVFVEVSQELIAIHPPASSMELVPRIGDTSDIAETVLDRLRDADCVVIDAPTQVGAADIVDDVTGTLRGRGVPVTVVDDASVQLAARVERDRRWPTRDRRFVRRLSSPRVAVIASVVLSVPVLAVAGLRHDADTSREMALTWLIEGRVAVEVPGDWSTERILVGPGSARVQVVSPQDSNQAVHVTQSPIPRGQSLASAAAMVRTALGQQPDGVFGGFDPAATVADEPAITYRETRHDRVVDWTLVLDGGVRIAIGCQSAPNHPAPRAVCEHAIRSAHEWR